METRTFSVIIPAYNEEKYLPGCLDSLCNMDYPKDCVEVIVVDNGSTDRTREIAETYKVTILRDDTKNVSGLRNLGARRSKGDILAFVDADCIVSKDWLKNAAKYFDDTETAAWGAPPALPEDSTWVQRTWYLVRQKEKDIQEVDWLESMNLFVRKDQFLFVNGFNETLVTCEDVDFCYRIREYGRIISDSMLRVVHLGEARTLREFIKKEIWRGQSNFHGIRSHGLSMKELPSLCIPVYFGIFLPAFLIGSVVFTEPIWLMIGLFFYLLPSAALLFKMRRKKVNMMSLFRLLFLMQIYFFSRTVAAVK